jgi:hypothetical protein
MAGTGLWFAAHIVMVIFKRVPGGFSHRLEGGEVNYRLDAVFREYPVQRRLD